MFVIDARRLPTVRSYADALRIWERSGQALDWRPLGKPRDRTKLVGYGPLGAVKFRFHNTDVVEWLAQDLLRVAFYDSVSTVLFARCFLPSDLYAGLHRSEMHVNQMRPKHGLINFRFEEGKWQPDLRDVLVEYQVVADAKKVRAAQERAREYIEYRRARIALGEKQTPFSLGVRYALRNVDALEQDFPQAHAVLQHVVDEDVLRAVAVAAGAVIKVPLPPGQLPRKTVYDDFF